MIRIDFFHDVICGWCYVFSPRLRKLAEEFDLDVHHHAFALSASPEEMISKFGSMPQAKEIILRHWEQCALADDAQRINVEGMRQKAFEYPFSTPGLKACKAAEKQGGSNTYWDYFDAVTHAHMSENRNIGDLQVLADIAEQVGLDKSIFLDDIYSTEREVEIQSDRQLAQSFGVTSTPTLIINNKWFIAGALDMKVLRHELTKILSLVN